LDNAKNVPEQLFGESFLRLSHAASGVSLEFTALNALKAWRKDDRPPVRVGAAEDWLKSRQKDVEASGAVSFEYDWCAICYMMGRHVFVHTVQKCSHQIYSGRPSDFNSLLQDIHNLLQGHPAR